MDTESVCFILIASKKGSAKNPKFTPFKLYIICVKSTIFCVTFVSFSRAGKHVDFMLSVDVGLNGKEWVAVLWWPLRRSTRM